MIWMFVAYAGLMLVIGLGFLGVGVWMILPFAGLEAAVIFFIFYYLVYRHGNDHELLIFDGDTVSVIKRQGRSESRYDFQRYWTRVNLAPNPRDWYPSRLLVGSHGRFIEVGAGIMEEDRRALAEKLKTLLGRTAYK